MTVQNKMTTHNAIPGLDVALVPHVDPTEFTSVTKKLRSFFDSRGFLEVHAQNRLSILAACEDPHTIATMNYSGEVWPLPQTGQMWLEWELLTKPQAAGFYCVTTSYRAEPNPVAGRHNWTFPMFEFEMHGDIEAMIVLQGELLEHLGFGSRREMPGGHYREIAQGFGVKTLNHDHEEQLCDTYGSVFFLRDFPEETNPFWNMRRYDHDPTLAKKVDVIIEGQETIGSAERSADAKQMLEGFRTIEDGKYAAKLYELFGAERVDEELKRYLANDFMVRSGGGIGMTRLIRAMKLNDLI